MIDYSIPAKNAMLQGLLNLIDSADPTAGYLVIYSATKPTTPGAAITTQILIGTIFFNLPCGTIADGLLTLDTPIEEDNSPNTGEIDWGRMFNGNDVWVSDFDIGEEGSGKALELSNLHSYKGGIIRINNGSFPVA